jgi:hypothetical protein
MMIDRCRRSDTKRLLKNSLGVLQGLRTSGEKPEIRRKNPCMLRRQLRVRAVHREAAQRDGVCALREPGEAYSELTGANLPPE